MQPSAKRLSVLGGLKINEVFGSVFKLPLAMADW